LWANTYNKILGKNCPYNEKAPFQTLFRDNSARIEGS
jgi:hypothetical protein